MNVLATLSHEFKIDWAISHDYSEGQPIGYIRNGKLLPELVQQINTFAEFFQTSAELEQEFSEIENQQSTPPNKWWNPTNNTGNSSNKDTTTNDPSNEDDQEGPHILPFKPKQD